VRDSKSGISTKVPVFINRILPSSNLGSLRPGASNVIVPWGLRNDLPEIGLCKIGEDLENWNGLHGGGQRVELRGARGGVIAGVRELEVSRWICKAQVGEGAGEECVVDSCECE